MEWPSGEICFYVPFRRGVPSLQGPPIGCGEEGEWSMAECPFYFVHWHENGRRADYNSHRYLPWKLYPRKTFPVYGIYHIAGNFCEDFNLANFAPSCQIIFCQNLLAGSFYKLRNNENWWFTDSATNCSLL